MSVVQEEEEPDVFNESINERSASFISTTIWINNHSRNLEYVSLEISNQKKRIFGFFTKSENGLSISRIHPKWIRFFLFMTWAFVLPDLNKLHIVSGLLAGPHHYCFHIKKSFGFSIRVICDQESKRLKRAAELQGRKGSRWSLRWGALRSATPINETADDNIEYSCMMSEFWWSSHEIFLGSFLFAYVDDAAGRYNVTFLRLCWYKITLNGKWYILVKFPVGIP